MSYDELIVFSILIAFAIGFLSMPIVQSLIRLIKDLKKSHINNKLFHQKKQEVQNMKDKGEVHEWINLPTIRGQKLVCKKTGWCPELEGFISKTAIDRHLTNTKRQEETEKEYQIFRDNRVTELSIYYNLDEETVSGIMSEAFKARQEFFVDKIKEEQELMEKQIEETRRQLQS